MPRQRYLGLTGYKIDELNAEQMEVVNLINVLVDGKFVQDLKDPALIWRGSSNRRTSFAIAFRAVYSPDDKRPLSLFANGNNVNHHHTISYLIHQPIT